MQAIAAGAVQDIVNAGPLPDAPAAKLEEVIRECSDIDALKVSFIGERAIDILTIEQLIKGKQGMGKSKVCTAFKWRSREFIPSPASCIERYAGENLTSLWTEPR